MILAVIACAAFLATLSGGLVALSLNDKLHLILGLSAGAVIGVAFFDLLPEAIAFGGKYHSPQTILSFTAMGFLFYLVLDRLALLHGSHQGRPEGAAAERGDLGAMSLTAHSFLDGVAIGLAFHASTAVGTIVTIAVLTHDFSDGINTMNIVFKNGGERHQAFRWLLADAIAPGIGVASTFFFTLPDKTFGIVLAIFAGFFLYIGASDLIPESYHSHPTLLTTAMTLLGVTMIYAAVRFAGQ